MSRSVFLPVVVFLSFLSSAGPVPAMHPLATDDTGRQGPGGVPIESSINYLKDNEYRSTVVPLALAGIIYEPFERYYLDAGIRVGLNERSDDYALLAAFGCKF